MRCPGSFYAPHLLKNQLDNAAQLWHTESVTALVDTHRLITTLQNRGFTVEQAEGIADAIEQIDLAALATKEDMQAVRLEIRDGKFDLLKWIIVLQVSQLAAFAAIVNWMVA